MSLHHEEHERGMRLGGYHHYLPTGGFSLITAHTLWIYDSANTVATLFLIALPLVELRSLDIKDFHRPKYLPYYHHPGLSTSPDCSICGTISRGMISPMPWFQWLRVCQWQRVNLDHSLA